LNESVVRYIVGVLLCVVISVAYAATRKRGLRAIALDSVFCLACMLAVVAGVAVVVWSLCKLK